MIPIMGVQLLPFCPDAETSKEQSPADVEKGLFPIFMSGTPRKHGCRFALRISSAARVGMESSMAGVSEANAS